MTYIETRGHAAGAAVFFCGEQTVTDAHFGQ